MRGGLQLVGGVGAGGEGDGGASGVVRHVQIVGGVADYQGFGREHAQFVADGEHHFRLGLGGAFVDGAGGEEEAARVGFIQGSIEPAPAFAGGHGEPVVLLQPL